MFTEISYGSGVPGGIFLPLLVIGALIGKTYGVVATDYFGTPESYTINFTILAMAAYFTAITKAPITASVLIVEMTNSFDHLLELIVVSIVAYVVVDLLNVNSIYDYLLERILGEHEDAETMADKEKKVLIEIPIEIGSSVEGKLIKDISWTDGCLIVGIGRGPEQLIPKGDTQIIQGDILIILTDEENACKINHGLIIMCAECIGDRD